MDIHASDILVAGGGIAGLAAALALSRRGADVQLIEQASAFSEVGAGIQIGPNVTRILRDWGLEAGLRQVASFPHELIARDARSGCELGSLPLGERAERLYGAPYACIHRADLHQLLLHAVQARDVPLHLNQRLAEVHLMRYGHAMAVPEPGIMGFFETTANRTAHEQLSNLNSFGPLRFAHADWAGYSIFEEAFSAGARVVREWRLA